MCLTGIDCNDHLMTLWLVAPSTSASPDTVVTGQGRRGRSVGSPWAYGGNVATSATVKPFRDGGGSHLGIDKCAGGVSTQQGWVM